MAKFLTRQDFYRILQRELPEDMYPDGAPQQYLSTADNDATAQCFSSIYGSMERVYENMFAISADEKLGELEQMYLGRNYLELTFNDRKNQILAKIRSQLDISRWSVLTQLAALVPGVIVDIVEAQALDALRTFDLRGELSDEVWGPGWQAGDPAPAGVTTTAEIRNDQSALLALRVTAYTYYALVFDSGLSTETKALIESTLSSAEPARSAHIVVFLGSSGVPASITFPEADRFNGNTALRQDPTELVSFHIGWFGFDGDSTALGFGDTNDAAFGGIMWPLYPGRT
jgi:hypothetical protein